MRRVFDEKVALESEKLGKGIVLIQTIDEDVVSRWNENSEQETPIWLVIRDMKVICLHNNVYVYMYVYMYVYVYIKVIKKKRKQRKRENERMKEKSESSLTL